MLRTAGNAKSANSSTLCVHAALTGIKSPSGGLMRFGIR
jgi:hypothetical protein